MIHKTEKYPNGEIVEIYEEGQKRIELEKNKITLFAGMQGVEIPISTAEYEEIKWSFYELENKRLCESFTNVPDFEDIFNGILFRKIKELLDKAV
jgi:hypothetical protein